jgi:hypothetical protein
MRPSNEDSREIARMYLLRVGAVRVIGLSLACVVGLLLSSLGLTGPDRQNVFSEHNLAGYVVDHLDLTSFANSIGPRRQAGKTTFADYGYRPVTVTDQFAELRDDGWYLSLKVLHHTSDQVTVCFVDRSENGGTYATQRTLTLQQGPSLATISATIAAVPDQMCPNFGGDG